MSNLTHTSPGLAVLAPNVSDPSEDDATLAVVFQDIATHVYSILWMHVVSELQPAVKTCVCIDTFELKSLKLLVCEGNPHPYIVLVR